MYAPSLLDKQALIQWPQVTCCLSRKANQSSIPNSRPSNRPGTSRKPKAGHLQRLDEAEHQGPAVLRSNTAPASYGYCLPIQSARQMSSNMHESNGGLISNEPGGPVRSASEPWKRTIHIHLDENQPDLTQVCRCLLDTGSDFNLISQRILRKLKLSFTPGEEHAVTGLGGVQILPIGSVLLRWHMDRHKEVTYFETFLVISDDTPAQFDVLIGNDWIMEQEALLPNLKILLARCLRFHRSPTLRRGAAETSVEGSQ
jgi:hypothetical protein